MAIAKYITFKYLERSFQGHQVSYSLSVNQTVHFFDKKHIDSEFVCFNCLLDNPT